MKKLLIFTLCALASAGFAELKQSNRDWRIRVVDKAYQSALVGGLTLPNGMFVRTRPDCRRSN